MPDSLLRQRLACSPCCLPTWTLEELLPAYGALGFSKIEAFSEWAQARLDWRDDPLMPRQKAREVGFTFSSLHLPMLRDHSPETLNDALAAARYAEAIGAKVVLFKAVTKEIFAQIGPRFLDVLDEHSIGVTPVLQNHKGSAISTLDDYETVFQMVNYDPRLKAVLEVGHFQRVGTSWQEGWNYLADRIALIHVNEIRDGQSVPYGTGEVDFGGLMQQIKTSGYAGDIVVELELHNHNTEPQQTLDELRHAVEFLTGLYERN